MSTIIPLNKYLEEYFNKDINTILIEAEQSKSKPIEIDWEKPVEEEI